MVALRQPVFSVYRFCNTALLAYMSSLCFYLGTKISFRLCGYYESVQILTLPASDSDESVIRLFLWGTFFDRVRFVDCQIALEILYSVSHELENPRTTNSILQTRPLNVCLIYESVLSQMGDSFAQKRFSHAVQSSPEIVIRLSVGHLFRC